MSIGPTTLWVLGIISLVASIWLCVTHSLGEAAFAGVLGLLVLAFARLSQFKKFKGLGFEAELWDQTLREAETLVEKMRGVVLTLAETTGQSVARAGRWDSYFSRREQLKFLESLRDQLSGLGIAAEKIDTIYTEFQKVTAQTLATKIWKSVKERRDAAHEVALKAFNLKYLQPIVDAAAHGADHTAMVEKFRMPFEVDDLSSTRVSTWAESIRTSLQTATAFSHIERMAVIAATNDDLLDLAAWCETRTVRRPEVFFADDDR